MSDINVNDLVNGLLDQIAQQAREIALLRVQLHLAQAPQGEQAGGEDVNGDE